MGILVVYQSKTGFTQKYAEWICEALECTCIPANQLNERDIPKFDLVIFGGGIHAGMISGLKKFKRKFKMNHGKRLVVFATGATPSDATEVIQQALDANFTEEERKNICVFYLQSGLNYEKMGKTDKFMMRMFCRMMQKKSDKSEEEIEMERMIQTSYDLSNKEQIKPLLDCVKRALNG